MNKFGIGQPVRRVEDRRFITGSGRFLDDITLPRQAYGALVLSQHAHARIKQVDVRAALDAPGVLAVLTGSDLAADKLGGMPPLFMPEDQGGPKGYRTYRPLLASDKLRYVGDRVAFVIAETAAQAREAAELVEVDVEPLAAAVTPEDAMADGALRIWEEWPNNAAFPLMMGNKDATDAAFAAAKHVVKLRLENNRLTSNSLEPRGAIGDFSVADDSYTLYTSTQNPHGARTALAQHVFHEPETKFRVVAQDVGGGFGMKGDTYPEEGLVLWASRRTGRPVKWVATRSESLLTDSHGRDQVASAEMALDENGKILAVRVQALHAVGAFVAGAAVVPVLMSLKLLPGPYVIPALHIMNKGVFTNTVPTHPYRGAGRPEATYIIERLIDQAAQETGIDSIELRRRNYIAPDAMPYKTPTGFVYDSGDFVKLTDRCLEMADWAGYPARRAESERRGRLRGRAFTYYVEDTGFLNDRMELHFDPSGALTIVAGTFSHGQGHATTYAQMVSDWLGIPFDAIRVVQGDTAQVPFGRGTYASRSATVGGSALKLAADALIEKAKARAAHLMEAAEADLTFKDGRFHITGTDRSMALTDVARAFFAPLGLPPKFGVGLDATGSFSAEPPNFPNGAHACELEIDPETGEVRVERYIVVDDLGRVINPLVCDGQIHGATAQGIGQALCERIVYDRESGQLLSGSFADYCMPRGDDIPDIETEFVEIPCETNPIGVKGAGEAGTVGAPPTVINAVLDALRPLGVQHIDMPATPMRIWEALRRAREKTA